MTFQPIDLIAPADDLPTGGAKINANFKELYDRSLSAINVKSAHGAKGDGVYFINGSVTGTSLTCSDADFTADDVGKIISITGAGSGGGTHVTTIAAYVSGTGVTLADAAPTSGGNRFFVYGTDDTDAIQSALAAAGLAGGGDIVFDDGIYIVNGPLKDTAESNAQLILPKINTPTFGITVRMRGNTPPLTTWGSNSGAILMSTLTTGNGQMIGCMNTHDTVGDPRKYASWVALYLEDMTVRLPANPTNSAIDVTYLPIHKFTNLRVDVVGGTSSNTTVPQWITAEPTTATSYGIKGGANDIPLWGLFDNVVVVGYYTGARLGELWTAPSLAVCSCKIALEIPEHRHPGVGMKIGVYNCPTIIKVTGAAEVAISMLDTEHNTASGSGPSWVTPFVADIDDPGNLLRGTINFHMHDTSIPLVFNGASKVHIKENTYPHSSYVPDFYPGFRAASHAATVARGRVQGQFAYNVLAAYQPIAAGYVGFLTYVNEAIAGTEKRVAQIYARTSGSGPNSANLFFATMDGGVLTDKWCLTSKGHLSAQIKGAHIVNEGGANSDMAGTAVFAAETSKTITYNATWVNAPTVVVTPQFDVGSDVRFWVVPGTVSFTIHASEAVTGTFAYQIIGNPY